MGTHPIFESDFDCLTESVFQKNAKRRRPCCRSLCPPKVLRLQPSHRGQVLFRTSPLSRSTSVTLTLLPGECSLPTRLSLFAVLFAEWVSQTTPFTDFAGKTKSPSNFICRLFSL